MYYNYIVQYESVYYSSKLKSTFRGLVHCGTKEDKPAQ